MSLPRYPEYKDSGVEWLGEVPAHWSMCSLKRVASLKSGESITADSIEETDFYPVYGGNGLRGFAKEYTHDGHFALIGRQGALCGNINYANGQFWASEHAVVVSPIKPIATTWLGELLRAMNLNQYSVSAAQPGLSVEIIVNLEIPYPPVEEQTAIATFLDRETAKIDGLIAEQEKLLDLLAEKRQATISHAVTKGLNPDAPMKDSGVAWLGEVPAQWEIKPMRYVSHLNPPISFFGFGQDDELTFLPMEQIKDGHYLPNTAPLAKYNSSYSTFDRGDILLAKVTPCFENGNIAIADSKGFGTSEIFVLRPQGIETRFLYWYLQSTYFKMDGEASMTGAGGLKRVSTACVCRHLVPKPTPEEQTDIVIFLDTETARLDALTAAATHGIDLLKERRSALISAAVTGKIDVRHLAEQKAA